MKLVAVIVHFPAIKLPDESSVIKLKYYKCFHLAFSFFEVHVHGVQTKAVNQNISK